MLLLEITGVNLVLPVCFKISARLLTLLDDDHLAVRRPTAVCRCLKRGASVMSESWIVRITRTTKQNSHTKYRSFIG
jgi:hypothetical protein